MEDNLPVVREVRADLLINFEPIADFVIKFQMVWRQNMLALLCALE